MTGRTFFVETCRFQPLVGPQDKLNVSKLQDTTYHIERLIDYFLPECSIECADINIAPMDFSLTVVLGVVIRAGLLNSGMMVIKLGVVVAGTLKCIHI